jgi:hypothetical protein
MIRRLFLAIILCLSLTACAPKHEEIPLFTYPSVLLASLSAAAHAADLNGRSPAGQPQKGLYNVLDTHSMEPTLRGGDYIVVDTKFSFANLKGGMPITYTAGWTKPGDPPVTHRTRDKTPTGWTVQGDNNNAAELGMWRVNEKDYIGKVVAIYRVKP